MAMIHKGRLLRAGALADVKRSTGRQFVEVAFDTIANGHMPGLNGFLSALSRYPVKVAEERADGVRVELWMAPAPIRFCKRP